jgi:hypothetical protein
MQLSFVGLAPGLSVYQYQNFEALDSEEGLWVNGGQHWVVVDDDASDGQVREGLAGNTLNLCSINGL